MLWYSSALCFGKFLKIIIGKSIGHSRSSFKELAGNIKRWDWILGEKEHGNWKSQEGFEVDGCIPHKMTCNYIDNDELYPKKIFLVDLRILKIFVLGF